MKITTTKSEHATTRHHRFHHYHEPNVQFRNPSIQHSMMSHFRFGACMIQPFFIMNTNTDAHVYIWNFFFFDRCYRIVNYVIADCRFYYICKRHVQLSLSRLVSLSLCVWYKLHWKTIYPSNTHTHTNHSQEIQCTNIHVVWTWNKDLF